MAGEHQGNGMGEESLALGGHAAETPSRAGTGDWHVLWYALVLSTVQCAVTLVGLLKSSNQELLVANYLPFALFLSAPACVSSFRMIFRAYPDALHWWALRLVLLGVSMTLLAAIYFFVGLLLPSLVPYGGQTPVFTVFFIGVAVTAPWLELLGSVVGLGAIAWDRSRRRRAENIG